MQLLAYATHSLVNDIHIFSKFNGIGFTQCVQPKLYGLVVAAARGWQVQYTSLPKAKAKATAEKNVVMNKVTVWQPTAVGC